MKSHGKISFKARGASSNVKTRQPAQGLSDVFRGGEEEDEQEQARRDFAAYQQEQCGFACPSASSHSPVAPITLATSRLALDDMEVETDEAVSSSSRGRSTSMTSDEGSSSKSDTLKERGNVKAEEGDFRTALLLWEEAINLNPRNAILYELKAQAHLQLEGFLEAVKAATRACELDPSLMEAKHTLGRAALSFGEVRQAVKCLSEVCGKCPSNLEARGDLIYANACLMELRRREEDFDLQLSGRAGLSEAELEVARAKRCLVSRGIDVSSDCYLGPAEPTSSDEEEGGGACS